LGHDVPWVKALKVLSEKRIGKICHVRFRFERMWEKESGLTN